MPEPLTRIFAWQKKYRNALGIHYNTYTRMPAREEIRTMYKGRIKIFIKEKDIYFVIGNCNNIFYHTATHIVWWQKKYERDFIIIAGTIFGVALRNLRGFIYIV